MPQRPGGADGFYRNRKSNIGLQNVKVLIPGNHNLIERAEIDYILLSNSGKLVGREIKSINIQKLEAALQANAFIRYAKVYADVDGVLNVQILQREPILRIINIAGMDFYVDKEGNKIPMSENFTANVLVANGLIYEDFNGKVDTLKSKLARDLYRAAVFISADTLWNNQIEQLYVNPQSEIEMVPRVGNQKIILGDTDSLKLKFDNLYVFYKKAMPRVGWDTYKTINIKYTNQVIGVRNADTLKIAAASLVNPKLDLSADSLENITQDTTKN
jgi:cell division protein FtsQ